MIYTLMGYLHAAVEWRVRQIRALAGEAGQGTVEYVGLILLVSLLMVGMVAAMKGFNRNDSKTRNLSQGSDTSGRCRTSTTGCPIRSDDVRQSLTIACKTKLWIGRKAHFPDAFFPQKPGICMKRLGP
jgi:hypothetical protein